MLESMIHNPRPTRAEASDVANAVLDGSDCVMLSGETANGPYFEQAVVVMARICCEAEKVRNYNAMYASIRTSVLDRYGGMSSGESLASSAVKTSIDINAAVIVVLSESGQTARYIAKFRPKPVVVCLTPSPLVARQTSGIVKGVHAYIVDSLSDDVELSRQVGYECVHVGLARPGDMMVVVSGTTFGHGQNNQIRVEPVPSADANYDSRKVMHHLHSFET
jgi:pyruvate kinase